MTRYLKTDVFFVPPIDPLIDQYLAAVGLGFNPGEMRRYCRREALRLNAKTDAELSLLGLTRDQIPAHVLRHRITPLAA
ncbi:MAG: hypothetical protein AAGC86_10895 [Pseudomonadota bacterium]